VNVETESVVSKRKRMTTDSPEMSSL